MEYDDSLAWDMGKEGVEPSRVAARDPKSRLSANSSTSPDLGRKIIR